MTFMLDTVSQKMLTVPVTRNECANKVGFQIFVFHAS